MKKKILGLIPVRLNSSRLNQKPLLLIKKIPLIIHTYRRAKLSKKLDELEADFLKAISANFSTK